MQSIPNLVDIIMIGYGLPDLEVRCFENVIKNTEYRPYKITYFDNFIPNLTLTEIWDKCIRNSDGEYVVLLNNDTEPKQGWLEKLIQTLTSVEKAGFVGPSTNSCHSPQAQIKTYEEAQKYPNKVQIMKDPISGFCVAFRKDLYEELGGFDMRFAHYGQESDLIERAQKQGYKALWRLDSFVYHVGEASVKKSGINVQVEREKARKMYWSTRK